jgi:hypothetical protein
MPDAASPSRQGEGRLFGRCVMCKLIRLMTGSLCDSCRAITEKKP